MSEMLHSVAELEEGSSLTGAEGGLWVVTTLSSHYNFDLDSMHVTRVPGPAASHGPNDLARPILQIVRCTVGAGGYWTMKAEGLDAVLLDYFWQFCTQISSITRVREFPSS